MILYLVNGMVVEVDEDHERNHDVTFGKNDIDIPCHTLDADRESLMVMAGKVVAYRD